MGHFGAVSPHAMGFPVGGENDGIFGKNLGTDLGWLLGKNGADVIVGLWTDFGGGVWRCFG